MRSARAALHGGNSVTAVMLCLLPLASGLTAGQEFEFDEVISREMSIFVGTGGDDPYRETVSREISIFVGTSPTPPYPEAISRELTVVVTTDDPPAAVAPFAVTLANDGTITGCTWENCS